MPLERMTNDIIGPIVESVVEKMAGRLCFDLNAEIVKEWRNDLTAALQAVAVDAEAKGRKEENKQLVPLIGVLLRKLGGKVQVTTEEKMQSHRLDVIKTEDVRTGSDCLEVLVMPAARLGEQGEGLQAKE